jgi:hypothetical protein
LSNYFKTESSFQFPKTVSVSETRLTSGRLPRGRLHRVVQRRTARRSFMPRPSRPFPYPYLSLPGASAPFSPSSPTSCNPRSTEPPRRHCLRRVPCRQAPRILFASVCSPCYAVSQGPDLSLYLVATNEIRYHLLRLRPHSGDVSDSFGKTLVKSPCPLTSLYRGAFFFMYMLLQMVTCIELLP